MNQNYIPGFPYKLWREWLELVSFLSLRPYTYPIVSQLPYQCKLELFHFPIHGSQNTGAQNHHSSQHNIMLQGLILMFTTCNVYRDAHSPSPLAHPLFNHLRVQTRVYIANHIIRNRTWAVPRTRLSRARLVSYRKFLNNNVLCSIHTCM